MYVWLVESYSAPSSSVLHIVFNIQFFMGSLSFLYLLFISLRFFIFILLGIYLELILLLASVLIPVTSL